MQNHDYPGRWPQPCLPMATKEPGREGIKSPGVFPAFYADP